MSNLANQLPDIDEHMNESFSSTITHNTENPLVGPGCQARQDNVFSIGIVAWTTRVQFPSFMTLSSPFMWTCYVCVKP